MNVIKFDHLQIPLQRYGIGTASRSVAVLCKSEFQNLENG